VTIPLYGMASAGNGYINQNEEIELITLPVINGNVKKTNFAAKVNGDSMEPKYHSGDVALIKKTGYDFDGLVYAVVYNEETYIKKSF